MDDDRLLVVYQLPPPNSLTYDPVYANELYVPDIFQDAAPDTVGDDQHAPLVSAGKSP